MLQHGSQPLISGSNSASWRELAEALAHYWSATWIQAMQEGAAPGAVSRVVATAEFRDALGAVEKDWRRHLAGTGGRRQQLEQHVRRVRARGDAPVPMLGVPGDRNRSMPLADLATADLPDRATLRVGVERVVRQLIGDVQRLARELKRDTRRVAHLLQETNTRTRRHAILIAVAAGVPPIDPVWDGAVRRRVRIAVRHILSARQAGRTLERTVTKALTALPWRRRRKMRRDSAHNSES